MSDRYPWELLVRYGEGRVTSAEVAYIASWGDERPEHAETVQRVTRMVSISRAVHASRRADVTWQRLQRRIEEATQAAGGAEVIPVRRSFQAALPSQHVSPWRTYGTMVGVAAAAVVAVGVAAWRYQSKPEPRPLWREVATRPGERVEFGLPDGSRVLLGAASHVRFVSEQFTRARTIELHGEAYFTVAHDAKHPFVVHAGGAAVQAVGTVFDVRKYAEDTMVQVAVAEGRVLLRPQAEVVGTGTMLTHGDVGLLGASGRARVQHDANLDLYLGWVHGQLMYEMVPASVVARDLERWYDLSIAIDDSARNRSQITITIDPTQPAPLAIQRLAEVLNLHVAQSGHHVHLTAGAHAAP